MTVEAEKEIKQPHSFEDFTHHKFYIAINQMTMSLAPGPVGRAVDIATGTGAMVEQMFGEKKLDIDFQIRGYDIDETALETARSKFYHYKDRVRFINAPAENIPLEAGWAQLVTFANAIHLTNAPAAIKEIARIMAPEGTLLINTAYEKNHAYPDEGSERSWANLVGVGRSYLKRKHGIYNSSEPVNLLKYSTDDLTTMLENNGFDSNSIHVVSHVAPMDEKDVISITQYDEFAKGALPGIPLDMAKACLKEAAESVFRRRKGETLPRGWTIIKARKLPKAA